MDYREKDIQIDGTRIHFAECGKGEPVILIHGLTNSWRGHIPLASFLGETYHLFIPDLPGYGDSDQLPRYSIETMSRYLQKFILAVGIQPVYLIGLSMGGFIVSDFAKTYPDLTRKAIVMGPVLRDAKGKSRLVEYCMNVVDLLPGGRFALKKIMETRTYGYLSAKFVNMYKVNMPLIDKYGAIGRKKMTKDAYVEMCRSSMEYDLEKTLADISVSTLLLYGREDRISGPRRAEQYLVPLNAHLALAAIPEAGHVVSFEKPQETATVINTFLGKN